MSAEIAPRPWSVADERRLVVLTNRLRHEIPRSGGDAVKVVVLSALGARGVPVTMQAAADRIGVERPHLSTVLAGKRLGYEIRRKLDAELRIPPGGMERLLAFLNGEPKE